MDTSVDPTDLLAEAGRSRPPGPGPDPDIDAALERAQTPGCSSSHHFNAAGSALPTIAVVDRVVEHLRLEQTCGGYEAAAQVSDQLDAVYQSAGELLGAAPEEVALFDSATTALRVVIEAMRPGPGHRVLVSRSTYVSHALHLLALAGERGVEVVVVPNGADGAVDLDVLGSLLRGARSTLVCAAHVPTSSGLVEPVAAIGDLARQSGARFVVDATQSVGHLAVDVEDLACDALVTTGRKFLRAPRGTGLAYVRRELLEQLTPTAPDVRGATWTGEREWRLVDSARRLESWETSVAGRLGLGVAIDEALARGAASTQRHLVSAGAALRDALAAVPRVTVQDPPSSASAIVTFTVDGVPAPRVSAVLSQRGVRTVSVPAGHAQWDLGARGVEAVVRASLHVYNDPSDTAALVGAVDEVAARGVSA